MVICGGTSSNFQEETIMEKKASKKLFGVGKPMPDMAVKPKKKTKKEPTMLEYHKKRTKKMGLM